MLEILAKKERGGGEPSGVGFTGLLQQSNLSAHKEQLS